MTRSELEHAIRAACDVADDSVVIVFGSQAILGQFSDAARELRHSIEVDLMPATHPNRVDAIDGALGEFSQFHQTHGFYVHGLSIEAAQLPPGWRKRAIRVVPVGSPHLTGLCIEAHDLAASKLAAFREKDREFVTTLLVEKYVGAQKLHARVRSLPISSECKERLTVWVRETAKLVGAAREQ
jgi:hypothetical protein